MERNLHNNPTTSNSHSSFGRSPTTKLQQASQKARQKSRRPLAKLQYIILSIIKQDCRLQGFCDRSIKEFANLSAHTIDGVKKALQVLNKEQYIYSKKQTRGYNSVRLITRSGDAYNRVFKKAPQKAPQKKSTLYKISSQEHDNADLLAKREIIKVSEREEQCFRALGFNDLDELIVITALRRRHLSREQRFKLANDILHAQSKRLIQHKRAYYMAAMENCI